MELNDVIKEKLRGKVTITRRNESTGEVIVSGENLVVNNAYIQLAQLLGFVAGIVNPIANIGLGIGGAVPAAVTDTTITGAVVLLPVVITYPAAYTVLFTGTWGPTLSSASDINEAGLLFLDNSLAARYCFSKMQKSLGWTWTIAWQFAYTV